MNFILRTAMASGIALFIGVNALPAAAVLATDYVAPKLSHLGKTGVGVAGTGKVIVKVLVKADGSFQVINVIRSTNPGDNPAALDIAKHSTYRVALRGGKPATAFYDFTLNFNGKSYASADAGGDSGNSGIKANSQTSAITKMLRSGNYAGAKAAATVYLTSHPGDVLAQSYLGLSNAFLGDDVAAAQAFDQVSSIPKQYQSLAAQTYALAAIKLTSTSPTQALAYAQKSMAIHPDGNAYFALGVAQLANNDAAGAVTNLKKARDAAMADSKTTTKEKVAIDSELLQAYTQTNDSADAQTTAAEIKQLDPSSTAAQRIVAQAAYTQADQLAKAGKYPESIKQWEIGAQADPKSAVTGYSQAALVMGRMDKPDFKAMSAEADKAIAAKADDPLANYAKGVALVNMGDPASKKSGIDFLNKADAEAKAANMIGLSLTIENFIKSIPK